MSSASFRIPESSQNVKEKVNNNLSLSAPASEGAVKSVADKSNIDVWDDQHYNKINLNNRGSEFNGNKDTRILEGKNISTAYRNGNALRQQGENSRKLSNLLGRNKNNGAKSSESISAGESGFLGIYKGHSGKHDTKTGQDSRRFWESHVRNLRKIKLQPTDSVGRTLTADLQKTLSNTAFKDDNGMIISLYHWTQNVFDTFAFGDGGFHYEAISSTTGGFIPSVRTDLVEKNPHLS